jgi:hypothetical protein
VGVPVRANVALQRILAKQIQQSFPADAAAARRCAINVVRAIKIALQLDEAELDGLMRGSMVPRPLALNEVATRRLVRTARRL